ncbi:MAG: hypothetical protein WCO23_01060 [bacterium]
MEAEFSPERYAAIVDDAKALAVKHGITLSQLSEIIGSVEEKLDTPEEQNTNDATLLLREYVLSGRHQYGGIAFWEAYDKLDAKKDSKVVISAAELVAGIDSETKIKGRLRFLKAFLEKSKYPARNYVTITGSEGERDYLVKLEANAFASGVKFEVNE